MTDFLFIMTDFLMCSETASSLVASVGNRDQWINNGRAGHNGNAIER